MPRKKSAGGSLGRSLVKSRNKKKANRRTKLADRKARSANRNAETGQFEDYGGMTGLTSVTELNSLDEFISHARMADRQFATERNQVTVVEDSMIGGSDAILGRAAVATGAAATSLTIENLKIPRRPTWDKTTTKEQLDKAERTAFLEWRRSIAVMEEQMRMDPQKAPSSLRSRKT